MFLSVVIPAFNEEKRIKKTLLDIKEYLSKQGYDSEIIVVNDGSEDRTAEIIQSLGIKNLQIINNKISQGKGSAVKKGLLKATGKYRLFMDADNSTSIEEVEKLLPYLNSCDIAIGSRSVLGADIVKKQPKHRLVLGKFYKLMVDFLLGLHDIKDTQCGFKIFSQKVIEDILPRCFVNGWSFDAEMLILAQKLNYKIREVPIKWLNQANSKVRLKGMIESIFDLAKIRWNLIAGKYNKKS